MRRRGKAAALAHAKPLLVVQLRRLVIRRLLTARRHATTAHAASACRLFLTAQRRALRHVGWRRSHQGQQQQWRIAKRKRAAIATAGDVQVRCAAS